MDVQWDDMMSTCEKELWPLRSNTGGSTRLHTHRHYKLSPMVHLDTTVCVLLTGGQKQRTEEPPCRSEELPHRPRVTFADCAGGGPARRPGTAAEEAGTRMVCLNSTSSSESPSLSCKLETSA